MSKYKFNSGYTLIEALLSVALIALIAGAGAPIYQAMQTRNSLDIAVSNISESLRRAQLLSQAVDGDSSWGVHLEAGKVSIFRGTSYVLREVGYDETFEIPTAITVSGLSDILFSKLYGIPTATGTISLISNTNESRTITINDAGMVNF